MTKKSLALLLMLCLLVGCTAAEFPTTSPVTTTQPVTTVASSTEAAVVVPADSIEGLVAEAVARTGAWLLAAVPEPSVASVGGDWTVLGLARSGLDLPEGHLGSYCKNVSGYAALRDGVLHEKKYTEYARVALALTACGVDYRQAAGYDLTKPLTDFDKVVWQGTNGPIFALLALNANSQNEEAEPYVAELLGRQLADGGFGLSGKEALASAPDVTAMAVQALAVYKDRPEATEAIEKALAFLAQAQNETGSYVVNGKADSETCAQVLIALGELGLDWRDERFVKKDKDLLEHLLAFELEDGSFSHHMGGKTDMLATEQAFLALVATQRRLLGQTSLYQMAQTDENVNVVTISVSCAMAVGADLHKERGFGHLPTDGWILPEVSVPIAAGGSVFTALAKTVIGRGIHMEYTGPEPLQYIRGIGNLYEFDGGPLSGWTYFVNGKSPGVGCGQYYPQPGDVITWQYTLDLGADLGGDSTWQNTPEGTANE